MGMEFTEILIEYKWRDDLLIFTLIYNQPECYFDSKQNHMHNT
jgi:hypothetical protein